jgi:hypothetical protein
VAKARKAGMAVGTEVARITVKVSPDSRGFDNELRRQLQSVDKRLRDTLDADLDVDTDDAEKKVSSAKKRMSAKKVNIRFDNKGLKEFSDQAAAFLHRTKGNFQPIDPKAFADMRRKMDVLDLRWQKKVTDFRAGGSLQTLDIKPKLEFAQLRAESNRIIQEYERVRDEADKRLRDIDVALNPELSRFNPKVLRARLQSLLGRESLDIPASVIVDDKKVKQDVNKQLNQVAAVKNGFKIPMPSFGSGVNPAGYAVIAAGVLLTLTPVLGLITTALMALPGLLSLILIPTAAITLGLDGFKKAAEKIAPQFEQLKTKMSEAAETRFTPVLQDLANNVFPLLERSLPTVTKGLGDMAQAVVNALKRPDNKLEESIRNIGTGLSAMSPGMDSFTSAFLGLINQFSLKMPEISKWFNGLGADFDAWVKKISADGSLSAAFDQLGTFIDKVIGKLGDFGAKAIDFMGTPGSLDGFLATLGEIANAVEKIIDLSAEMNKNWQGLVQVGRGFNALSYIMQGDFEGSFANARDLFANKPWLGAKEDVDALNGSIKQTAEQAAASQQRVQEMLSGGGAGGSTASGDPLSALKESLTTPPPPVEAPDLEPAKAEITEYQSFVDSVTQQVRGSLEQATSGESLPAPNFEAFKSAWSSLPGFVTEQMSGVRNAAGNAVQAIADVFQIGGVRIVNEVAMWPGAVAQALAPLGEAGATVANQLVQGLVNGINAGIGAVTAAARNLAAQAKAAANAELGIKSPSREFEKIGDYTAQGFAKGLENGIQPVIDQARDLADKVSIAFANGSDPTGTIEGYSKQEIDRIEKALAFESRRLESQAKALDYQAKMSGNEALKARAQELRMQKDQIGLQKDMIGLTQEYGDELGSASGDNPFAKAASGLMNAPVDFAKATGQQFLSDLGIGGNGLISKAITEGISYVFNIGSVDEALSIKDREDSKQAMAVTGRG